MKEPSPSPFPSCLLWLTLAGAFCGLISAFYLHVAEPVTFESAALIRPVRPPDTNSSVSHRAWLNTEAVAMESRENLQRVAANLNLETEWKRSSDGSVETLKRMVKVETVPESALLRITVRSSSAPLSAKIANAVTHARDKFYRGEYAHKQFEKLLNHNGEKTDNAGRRELLNALATAKFLPEYADDAALMKLTLPEPLKKLRNAWAADKLFAEESEKHARENPPPSAEILEMAVPALNPVDTGTRARMVTWTAGGALAALLLSLALKFIFKRSPNTSGKPGEARGFFRRYAPGMAFAGILAGTIAGILQSNLEKPVFESTAVFQPARMDIPPAGVTYREWLNTEAAAMASQKNLEQVALRLNLPYEWRCSMEECVARLKSQLEIAAVPDTELIRLVAHGPSAGECASVANAAIAAREDQTVTAPRPEVMARISERSAKLTALEKSASNKRSELVTGIQALNILVNTHSDEAINALTLPQLLSDSRSEWHDELARVETAKTELAASGASAGSRQPYAKILESAVPSVNPLEREWIPRSIAWSAAGAGIALALCLLLAIEERRSTPQHKEGKPPVRPPLLAGDY